MKSFGCLRSREHPITAGLSPFNLTDETYKGMWISPAVKVLLKTDNPTSDGPVAWISPYEKSRVVCVQLGHDSKAHRNPCFSRNCQKVDPLVGRPARSSSQRIRRLSFEAISAKLKL